MNHGEFQVRRRVIHGDAACLGEQHDEERGEGQHMRLSTLLEMSAAYQALAHGTRDHREAVDSMLEKRAPSFEGR